MFYQTENQLILDEIKNINDMTERTCIKDKQKGDENGNIFISGFRFSTFNRMQWF
jgi:hypothetical protein